MKKASWALGVVAFGMVIGVSAYAGEGLFSRAYTTETVPMGHFELEQLIRNRASRAFGVYSAFDFKSEFEYGLTDNFQAALYINYEYMHAVNAPDDNHPDGDQPGGAGFNYSGIFLQGISTEFLYRAISPISNPVGLAFYLEPEWNFHDPHNAVKTYDSMGLEFRTILQANFFDDQLVLVYNLVLETQYSRYGDGDTLWMGEFDWNNEFGASYRFTNNWYAGVELRNHNEVGNFYTHDHSAFWVGPAIHYGGPGFWATLGVLAQVSGNPNGFDEAGSYQGNGLFLHSHELWETTLKAAVPF